VLSVFRQPGAAPEATGMPCIVFVGNAGGDQALAQVAAILNARRQDRDARRIAARPQTRAAMHCQVCRTHCPRATGHRRGMRAPGFSLAASL
jgi:hypothetical protein